MNKRIVVNKIKNKLAIYIATLLITKSDINKSKICVFYKNKKNLDFVEVKKYCQVQFFKDVRQEDKKLFTKLGEFDVALDVCGANLVLYSGNGNYLSLFKWQEFLNIYNNYMFVSSEDIIRDIVASSKTISGKNKKSNLQFSKNEILKLIDESKKKKILLKV